MKIATVGSAMKLSGKRVIPANGERTTGISTLRPEAERQLSANTSLSET
ncbi:MAG: hypothetical protein H0X53_06345 [Sphingomonas sp.]|nr:hypothetical protein [Sphingomonas sp.]